MHSSIFSGQLSHRRRSPKVHAFRYRVFMMYLDLAELDDVFRGRWLWSTHRPAIARFRRSKYYGDPKRPLDECIRDLVASKSGQRPSGPIRLLTHLDYYGYGFNPISLYYCFDEDDSSVESIVAEVSNTPWGEKHCYVLSRSMDRSGAEVMKFRTEKELHVSPFMGMAMTYDWALTEPGEDLIVQISNLVEKKRLFSAAMVLKRSPITATSLARVLLLYPLLSFRVTWGIHWQALRLWLKGVPPKIHPNKLQRPQENKN